jgi:hypothetical protein
MRGGSSALVYPDIGRALRKRAATITVGFSRGVYPVLPRREQPKKAV